MRFHPKTVLLLNRIVGLSGGNIIAMQHIPSAIVYLGIIPVVTGIGNKNIEKSWCSAFFRPDTVPHQFCAWPLRAVAPMLLTRAEVDFGIATPS